MPFSHTAKVSVVGGIRGRQELVRSRLSLSGCCVFDRLDGLEKETKGKKETNEAKKRRLSLFFELSV